MSTTRSRTTNMCGSGATLPTLLGSRSTLHRHASVLRCLHSADAEAGKQAVERLCTAARRAMVLCKGRVENRGRHCTAVDHASSPSQASKTLHFLQAPSSSLCAIDVHGTRAANAFPATKRGMLQAAMHDGHNCNQPVLCVTGGGGGVRKSQSPLLARNPPTLLCTS
jgi:hypothetical protein